MSSDWTPILGGIPAQDPLMWVWDTATESIIDQTPATAAFLKSYESDSGLRTLSHEFHATAALEVVKSRETHTTLEWIKYQGVWRKLSWSKMHLGGSLVLNTSQDITQFDPRAQWLARINLETQRLELDSGESISFDEFVVLHMLLKGLQHKRIAQMLNITAKTVEYRISRLKDALQVESTEEMMLTVSANGLIYLGLIPMDPENPALTELELYAKVIG
ncbi:MAG: LuxR C-terminal-related transcriptional regulator [Halioglobus sp.]